MSSLGSRLPEEEGYWDDLADRITTDAGAVLAEYHVSRGVWWSSLARGCPALVATALIATAAVSLTFVFTSEPATAATPSPVARAIEPNDALARRFLEEDTPPSVEILLPLMTDSRGNP